MSRTVPRGREAGQQTAGPQPEALATAEGRGSRGHGRWVALCVVVVVAAGVVAGWRGGMFSSAASPGTRVLGEPAPATAPVVREDIAAATPVAATLRYAGSYTVLGQGGGTLTWLPRAGQVISQGQVLYETGNGSPVALLYGSVPDWREMSEGTTGADVSQLNHDLVALGDAGRAEVSAAGWDYYSWETAYGVQRLEEHLGVSFPPGSLSLGQVVFKPEAIRVARMNGSLGGPASGPVMAATSEKHVVMIPLDVSQESEVRAGDAVTVTLPDGTTTPGVISSVGTVAITTPGSQGQNPVTTIPVQAKLTNPGAARTLDQAPVTVNITTATARNVLVVPVTPGIFDDNSGLVQVAGALTPGQRVVVAAT